MRTAAIVPAAGRGERLGPGVPKALRLLGGSPLFVHAVRALARARGVDVVVIAAPAADVPEVERLLAAVEWRADIDVVPGGERRHDSVRQALAVLPDDVDVVLVHDAARPLAPPELAESVTAAVRDTGADACVPVVPLVDTVKEVDDATVVRTLDRRQLRAVQTPQAFRRSVLVKAHAWAANANADELETITDDAGMVERLGFRVHTVPGVEEAFKVTRPLDLVMAEAVLARRKAAVGR
ncbi:MAG TPA: 2-C-methyl-D-erythritol 4-phosphate cytidylyltransferase [Actinopolymorphaceae bacterium]|jgi:2-C-methyl-D-erythritol 4-phosphate cytidylyltransferase